MRKKSAKRKSLPMTAQRLRVLQAFRLLTERNPELPPSLQELADELGLVRGTVAVHIRNLIRAGKLVRTGGWRSLEEVTE